MEQSKIWEYFQSQAGYDSFEFSEPRYRFLAKRIPSGSKALNIGVGRGGLEALLIQNGVDIYSLDPSKESIKAVKLLGVGERAKVGYSQNIPFPNETFDVVVMSEVLEHLDSKVLASTLTEVHRVLKKGGGFIGTVPANELLESGLVICPDCGNKFHRWGHVQSFSPDRFEAMLEENHFIVSCVQYRAFPNWTRKSLKGFVKSILREVLGRLGSGISQSSIFFYAKK